VGVYEKQDRCYLAELIEKEIRSFIPCDGAQIRRIRNHLNDTGLRGKRNTPKTPAHAATNLVNY
jgi:hypothetical protein